MWMCFIFSSKTSSHPTSEQLPCSLYDRTSTPIPLLLPSTPSPFFNPITYPLKINKSSGCLTLTVGDRFVQSQALGAMGCEWPLHSSSLTTQESILSIHAVKANTLLSHMGSQHQCLRHTPDSHLWKVMSLFQSLWVTSKSTHHPCHHLLGSTLHLLWWTLKIMSCRTRTQNLAIKSTTLGWRLIIWRRS